MNKTEKLIEVCLTLEPMDGRIIILPGKVRTYKERQMVPKPLDPESFKIDEDYDESNEVIPEVTMEEELIDVNYRYQKAVVLQKPDDENRLNVGDTIIYQIGTIFDFDLIKGVSLIRKWDVIAVVKG